MKEEKKIKVKTVLAVSASLIFAGGAFYLGFRVGRENGIRLAQAGLITALTNSVDNEINKV